MGERTALLYLRDRLPPRFLRLINEARRARYKPSSRLPGYRLRRMADTLAFISYAHKRGIATLDTSRE